MILWYGFQSRVASLFLEDTVVMLYQEKRGTCNFEKTIQCTVFWEISAKVSISTFRVCILRTNGGDIITTKYNVMISWKILGKNRFCLHGRNQPQSWEWISHYILPSFFGILVKVRPLP